MTLALTTPSAAQAPDPLAIDEALDLALENQPALDAYGRTARASEEAAVAARQLPDFEAVAGVRNLPVTGSNPLSFDAEMMTMRFVGIGRRQVRGAKRRAASARLLAEAEVARADEVLMALRIERDVLLAWTDAVEAQERQAVLESLAGRLEARVRTAEANVPTGRASAADAVAAQADVSAVRAEIAAARGAEASARAMLARWIGDAVDRPLAGGLPICRLPGREIVRAAIDGHPQLELARSRTAVAERSIDIARADRLPDWGWSIIYGNRGGGRSDMVSLQLSMDLPFNRSRLQDRRVAEAGELAAAARDRTEDMRRELTAGLEQALAEFDAAQMRLETTAEQTLPALRAAEQAQEARFEGGGGSLESVLIASERTVRAALDLVEQRAAVARASADLHYYSDECLP